MSSATLQPSTKLIPETLFARNPRQVDAWRESWKHRFLLYGGAAGGGKSFWLRWWCVFYLMALHQLFGVRAAQVILASEDYPTLSDRQISKIRAEFPPQLGTLTMQPENRMFTLAEKYGSGRILLRNLDDPSKYLSTEFAGAAVEELTRNPEQTFHDLRLRLRWPGVAQPRFVAATNPGGIGHGWVKRLWIDRDLSPELRPLADQFYFVQAKATDNPYLLQTYYEDLKTLPDAMRAAYLEGRWDLFVGQYFTIFSPEKHVIRAEDIGLKDWHARWISMDWGFEHPSAIYWHVTTDHDRHVTYREAVVKHTAPRDIAKLILHRSQGENIEQFFLSPDAFAHRTDEASIAEQITEALGDNLCHPMPAATDRIGGWMLMYQMLQSGAWKIADTCPRLIASIPNAVRDEKRVEDVAKHDGDDELDAARMGLYSRIGPQRAPIEVQIQERVAAMNLPDMTQVAMQSARVGAELQRQFRPVKFARRGLIRSNSR